MNVSSCWHVRFSGVTKVLGARGQKQYSGPPFWGAGARGLKVKCYTMEKLMPKQVGKKWKTSVFLLRLVLLSHSGNSVILTFVTYVGFRSHVKIASRIV